MDSKSSEHNARGTTANFVLKSVIVGVIIFVGIAGGVYVGYALSLDKAHQFAADDLENRSYLFAGDRFPNHQFTIAATGDTITIKQLTEQGPIILALMSNGCDACERMRRYWGNRVLAMVDKKVRVYYAYEAGTTIPPDSSRFSNRVVTLFADRTDQVELDGMDATPSIVVISKGGIVRGVSSGFDRRIDSGLLNSLCE